MRRPTEEGAGRPLGGDRESAEDVQRLVILADERTARKQAVPPIGNCINCGQHIRLTGGATTCPTCTAWRRWYVAHRIASRLLREAMR